MEANWLQFVPWVDLRSLDEDQVGSYYLWGACTFRHGTLWLNVGELDHVVLCNTLVSVGYVFRCIKYKLFVRPDKVPPLLRGNMHL